MKYLVFILFITLVISCDNQEVVDEMIQNEPEKTFYITGPNTMSISFFRQYNWKISLKPFSQSGCVTGKGLCITGDELPDPNNTSEYGGTMSDHQTVNTKVIFIFPNSYIEDEDELIDDGFFMIDTDFSVDSAVASLLGKDAFTILEGDYEIVDDGSGFQEVIVDIEL